MNAMHGRPSAIDQNPIARGIMTAMKVVHGAGTQLYSLALPPAALHVLGSSIYGNTARAYGPTTWAKGLVEGMKNPEKFRSMVATDVIATDMTLEPRSPLKSAMKVELNALRYPVNAAHHIQSYGAAGAASVAAGRALSGEFIKPGLDRSDFLNTTQGMFGLDKELTTRLADGKGTSEEYEAYVQKATSVLSNRNTTPLERSKLENSRLFGSLTRAMSYPISTARNLGGVLKSFEVAVKSGDPLQYASAGRKLLASTTGLVITGYAAKMIASVLTGGPGGLTMAMQEDEDKRKNETLGWLKSMVLSGVGGPVSVLENMHHSTMGLGNFSYDIGLLGDMASAVNGSGRYKDMDKNEIVSTFASDRFRMGRVMNTWLGVLGSGGDSIDLDNAHRALGRFKDDSNMARVTTETASEPDGFRAEMRRALELVKDGKDPSEHIKSVLNLPEYHDIASSIRARQLLKNGGKDFTPEELKALTDRIGPEAVKRLQDYDDNLSAWAHAYEVTDKLNKNYGSRVAGANLPGNLQGSEEIKAYRNQAVQERFLRNQRDENLRRQRLEIESGQTTR